LDREVLATFANVDFQRTRFWCLCASVAIQYPRRLPDATPQELTYDKRVSRRVCGSYRTLWRLYDRETEVPPPPEWSDWPVHFIDPLMNRIGATVIWPRQIDFLIDTVVRRMHKLTEFDDLVKVDGLRRWYNIHDTLLEWELDALYRLKTYAQTKRPSD